jgi:hypothetical protein
MVKLEQMKIRNEMIKRKIKLKKKYKTEIEKYPLVEVRWLDICSDSSWSSIKEAMAMTLPVCNTKGHLLSQTKGITRIFSDYSSENDGTIEEIGNVTIIPNNVIVDIKKIS